MDTMRFRAFQQPSRVQAMLDSLVRKLLPLDARNVTDRSALPSTLQKLIFQALKSGQGWSTWLAEDQIWLFIAEMSLAPSRERGCPALQISIYREDGKMKEWRQWACMKDGTWQPCAA